MRSFSQVGENVNSCQYHGNVKICTAPRERPDSVSVWHVVNSTYNGEELRFANHIKLIGFSFSYGVDIANTRRVFHPIAKHRQVGGENEKNNFEDENEF